jgi:hypothetical protein
LYGIIRMKLVLSWYRVVYSHLLPSRFAITFRDANKFKPNNVHVANTLNFSGLIAHVWSHLGLQ